MARNKPMKPPDEPNEFDGMQELFDEAFRNQREEEADKAMEDCRTVMVMSQNPTHAFFAALVMKMKHQADWKIDAAATDGRTFWYNPEFLMANAPREKLKTIHAKSVMHAALNHPQMLVTHRHLDRKKLQLAMELVVNEIMRDASFTLPDAALLPGKGKFRKMKPGLSSIETYREIPDSVADKFDDPSNPSGMGGVSDAKADDGSPASESDIEQQLQESAMNVAQAQQMAKMRGTISAGMQLLIDGLLKPKVPWREVLRDWVSKKTRTDISWKRLNRRYVASGTYLPSLSGETIGKLVLWLDTSGSMHCGNAYEMCIAEIMSIAEQLQCGLTIGYHDAEVRGVQQWTPEDGPLKLTPKGGGGTDHRPCFKWMEDHMADFEDDLAGVIFLTDCATVWPSTAPAYPVITCSTTKGASCPFGMTIFIDEDM